METCEIVMTRDRQGYPERGTTLTVDKLRAYRWCGDMCIARFKSKKEHKIDDAPQGKKASR